MGVLGWPPGTVLREPRLTPALLRRAVETDDPYETCEGISTTRKVWDHTYTHLHTCTHRSVHTHCWFRLSPVLFSGRQTRQSCHMQFFQCRALH